MGNLTNRIAVILDIKGMTQIDLAAKLGCDESHINRIIKGKQTPRLDMAFKISQALDVPIEKIFLMEESEAA